jgi:hypothetical protein
MELYRARPGDVIVLPEPVGVATVKETGRGIEGVSYLRVRIRCQRAPPRRWRRGSTPMLSSWLRETE